MHFTTNSSTVYGDIKVIIFNQKYNKFAIAMRLGDTTHSLEKLHKTL